MRQLVAFINEIKGYIMLTKISGVFLLLSCLSFAVSPVHALEVGLSKRFAEKASISLDEADRHISLMFDSISDALIAGEQVQVRNFGTFYSKNRKPRTAKNPKTGEVVQVPSRSYPRFRSSKSLKKLLNN
jgi:nucleoid DNA-binding protein